jgi:hypothetical protein
MADIISFEPKKAAVSEEESTSEHYHLDVSLYPDDLRFTLRRVKVQPDALLKIAQELEQIASIIRSDVITGTL